MKTNKMRKQRRGHKDGNDKTSNMKNLVFKLNKMDLKDKRNTVGDMLYPPVSVLMKGHLAKARDVVHKMLRLNNSESQYMARLVFDEQFRRDRVRETITYFHKEYAKMNVEKKKTSNSTAPRATSPPITLEQLQKMSSKDRTATMQTRLWNLIVDKDIQTKFSRRGIQEILTSIINQHDTVEKQMKLLTNTKWRKKQFKWWSRLSQWQGLSVDIQKKMARTYVYPKFQAEIQGDEAEKIYIFVASRNYQAHNMIRFVTDPEFLRSKIQWARQEMKVEEERKKKMEEEKKMRKKKMEEEQEKKLKEEEEQKKKKLKEKEEEEKKKKKKDDMEEKPSLYLDDNDKKSTTSTSTENKIRRREPVPRPRGRRTNTDDSWNVVKGTNNNTPSRGGFESRSTNNNNHNNKSSADRYANRNKDNHHNRGGKTQDPEAQIYRLLESSDDVRKLQNIWNGCSHSTQNQLKKVTAINSARFGRSKCCIWILDRGADPNTSTKKRSTLLHYSAYLGVYELVDALLKRGAATNIRNTDYNETAEETAMSQTHIKCAKLIRNNPNVLRKRGGRNDRNNNNRNNKNNRKGGGRGGKPRRGRRRNDLELMRSLPLLSEDVLKQSSNAWSKRNKEESSWEDKLRALLNKINSKEKTPELYEKNIEKILNNFPITDSLENFESLVDSIFAAAIRMPTFANTFANLCDDLNTRLSDIVRKKDLASCEKDEDGSFLVVAFGEKLEDNEYGDREEATQAARDLCDFSKRIKEKCQEEFEMGIELEEEQLPKEIMDLPEADINRRRAVIRLEQRQNKLKDMIHGNLGFMGELFKKGIVPTWGVHGCIGHLLQKPNKDNILCLKKFLITVGSTLDRAGEKKRVDKHFTKIKEMIKSHSDGSKKLESQAYFALKDIVDLRNEWGSAPSSSSSGRRGTPSSSRGDRSYNRNDRRRDGGYNNNNRGGDDRRRGGDDRRRGGYDRRGGDDRRGGYNNDRRRGDDRRGGYNDRRRGGRDDRFERSSSGNNRFSSRDTVGRSQDFRRQPSNNSSSRSQDFRRTPSSSSSLPSSFRREETRRQPKIRFQDQEESKSNNLTRDKVKRRVVNTLKELVSNADTVSGAIESVKDLKMSGQDEMEKCAITEIFDFTFQTKAQDEESRKKIGEFLNLMRSSNIISSQNFDAAVSSLEGLMDDIKIDCPKAPEYFKTLVSSSSSSSSKKESSLSDEDKKKIRRRVENAAKELASNASNVSDSTLDIKELKGIESDSAQSFAVLVLLEWYIQSSPGKDKDGREKVCELLKNLLKENVVSKNNAKAASDEIKSILPDVKIDCPMAPKFFDEIFKTCLE
jgi:hypothetical protein